MKPIILPTAIFLLAACNREEQPEAPTPAEAARLNEAEAMLNELANEEATVPEPAARRP